MSTFLITKKESGDWNLPVFCLGPRSSGDAIAVFTSRLRASHFLKANRLEQNHQLDEIAACELIDVIFAAFENNVDYICINPKQRNDAASPSRLLPVRAELAKFARELSRRILDRGSIS